MNIIKLDPSNGDVKTTASIPAEGFGFTSRWVIGADPLSGKVLKPIVFQDETGKVLDQAILMIDAETGAVSEGPRLRDQLLTDDLGGIDSLIFVPQR